VGFYNNLSAADNLRYTARLNGFTPAEREERIKSSLAHAGLSSTSRPRALIRRRRSNCSKSSATLRGLPQGDVELMTQKEVLDFKPAP
jgi:ABC-type Na+ transport system ATPase subunit NatA